MTLEALQLVAARFKVLSDPMRLRILQVLENGETSVSELAEAVESTQPNVSKHTQRIDRRIDVSHCQLPRFLWITPCCLY